MTSADKHESYQRVRPQRRLVISMHPYLPIEKNDDGTGGGILLRIRGGRSEPYFLPVRWGESTEIEIVGAELWEVLV